MYSPEDLLRLTGKLWAPLVCLKQSKNCIRLQGKWGEQYGYWGNVSFILPGQHGVVISTTYSAKAYLRRKLRDSGSLTDPPVLQYPI